MEYKYADGGDRAGMTALWLFDDVLNSNRRPVQLWLEPEDRWDGDLTKLVAADFTGDGIGDIAALYEPDYSVGPEFYDIQVRLQESVATSGFTYGTIWSQLESETGSPDWDWDRLVPLSGDYSGDGVSDIAVVCDTKEADGDLGPGVWVFDDVDSGEDPHFRFNLKPAYDWDNMKWVSADYSGDGKSDLVGVLDHYKSTADTDGETWMIYTPWVNQETGKNAAVIWDWLDEEGSGWVWSRLRVVS